MIKIEKVAIYIFPNVEDLDFVGVFEVLAKARLMKADGKLPIETPLQIDVLASEDPIVCANGLIVKPHKISDTFEGYDLLIIPGGRGVNQLITDKEFLAKIQSFAENKIICSVCTGAFVLGEAGVLTGKRAATHHKARESLKEFCGISDSRVHIDGSVISAGGVSCALDLGLKILELVYGKAIAEIVANHLEIPSAMRPYN
ncbi:MAG: DJ-1/PfpI family protein [Candidatus Heimdallarchaeota archaeon]